MTTLALIWAQGRNREIGRNNELPWNLPEDLAYFKAMTMGYPVIMGRKTFESIGRPLPGRRNLVVTSVPDWLPAGVTGVDGFKKALSLIGTEVERVTVIGGGLLYAQALPLADELLVTDVYIDVPDADAWAPKIDESVWEVVERSAWRTAQSGLNYRFTRWRRKTQ